MFRLRNPYPDMDTWFLLGLPLPDPHSDEQVHIESVGYHWTLLTEC